ncbi:MAG: PilZ domain-containing protein [Clostridia bacterium]|nr:PilZ domain-containing protein [Clostridia bacterium]
MYTVHLKAGDIVSIRHYSGINPFKSVVLDANEDILLVRLTKDFALMNFLEGDPIVFGYELEGQIFVYGGNISCINNNESIVELNVDKVEEGAEKRQYERYPVSLYADMRERVSRKKYLATIKDISYYGIKIYSKSDIELKQELEIDIYMDKNMLFLKATVLRKNMLGKFFEYGMGIHYEDTNSINAMKEYIKRLINEQEEAIRKLRGK